MDDSGNILIKRIAKANVYVKSGDGENAVANEILKVRVAQNDNRYDNVGAVNWWVEFFLTIFITTFLDQDV